MKNARIIVLSVVGVLTLLLVLRLTLFAPKPDDQALIAAALTESLDAAKEGRPSVVLDKLSQKFRINSQSPGSRWDIAKFVRESKPEVVVTNKVAVVSGDTARIVSPVQVHVSYLNQNFSLRADEVTLVFEREDDRIWLFVPTKSWKLTDVSVPQRAIEGNLAELGGVFGL